jgi:NADPH:quinone reductase-like Zn-dependent oxidoreductase
LKAAGATHVLDRNAPVTKAKIQAITTSPIKTVVDAISNAETQRQGFEILSSGGKQLLVLQPESFWESEGKEQDKTGIQVTGSKRYPQHADLAKELYKKFTGLLENGDIKVRVMRDDNSRRSALTVSFSHTTLKCSPAV